MFACDACPSGCGGISRDQYFHEEFPSSIAQLKMHINALELLTLVVALKVWGSRLRGKRVLMFCDNMSSVNLINKGLSRDDFHQSCLREICFTAAVNNFAIKAQHTRGRTTGWPIFLPGGICMQTQSKYLRIYLREKIYPEFQWIARCLPFPTHGRPELLN